MKKVNKNKKVVKFIKDHGEIKKGTKKMLPLMRAIKLIDAEVAIELKDETAKLKEDIDEIAIRNKKEIEFLKKRVQFLENIVNSKKKKDEKTN